jgi:hypothetical protein
MREDIFLFIWEIMDIHFLSERRGGKFLYFLKLQCSGSGSVESIYSFGFPVIICKDPHPDPSINKQKKKVTSFEQIKKKLGDFYSFVTS